MLEQRAGDARRAQRLAPSSGAHRRDQVLARAVAGHVPRDPGLGPREHAALDLDDLSSFVAARMAGYKRPRAYELRDELPRTDAGKLLKRVLRDQVGG